MRFALILLAMAACGSVADDPADAGATDAPPTTPGVSAGKRARLVIIHDAAAARGMTNGPLLAGIAESETNVSHCWADLTFACKGPDSPSCDGGPVVAGAGDGPCSAMEGGLGMFQFDAGTFADTRALYGDAILTIEGNTAQAVTFVVAQVIREVPGIADEAAAIDWMNGVPLVAGDPKMEQWAKLLACRYNGCCTTADLCIKRANDYRDHAIELGRALGDAFWR